MKFLWIVAKIFCLFNFSSGETIEFDCPNNKLSEIEASDLLEYIEISRNLSNLIVNKNSITELHNFKELCEEEKELRPVVSEILESEKCFYDGQARNKLVAYTFCNFDDDTLKNFIGDTLYNRIQDCEQMMIQDCLRPSEEMPDYCRYAWKIFIERKNFY